jgi:hypothetical protein
MTAGREEWEYLANSSASGRPRDVLGYSTVAHDGVPLLVFSPHQLPKLRGRAADRFSALLDELPRDRQNGDRFDQPEIAAAS